jgi:hypothetical protein
MSEFRIDQIKSQDASRGPDIAGITTFTGTSGIVMPSGNIFRRYSQDNIVDDGLILYLDAGNVSSYPGSGTVWYDLTARTNGGTLINGPTYSSSDGGSIVFDGENDRIHVLDLLASTIGETFTAETWIYPTDFSAPTGSPSDAYPRRIMTCHRSSGSTKWCLGIDTSGRLGFGGAAGAEEAADKKYQLSLNTYYHVVLSHNGTSYKIYVNGTEEVDQTTSPIDSGSVSNLAISGRPETQTDRVFEGRIPQVRIYSRPLIPSEIKQNFNAFRGRYGL